MNVLDKGSIELVGHMGNDTIVANAARISFANADWFKEIANERDEKLIHYLASHKHVSPFYHPHVMFTVKASISVQRQAFKHKIGTAENSESTRYTEVKNEFYLPERFRTQSKDKKQGSGEDFPPSTTFELQRERSKFYNTAYDQYEWEIALGVSRELARDVLPLATYTSWCWTMSLLAAVHFIELRDADDAQFEIREYGKAMRSLIEPYFPVSIEALLGRSSSPTPSP